MDKRTVRYQSEKYWANVINEQERHCRIGKVLPKPVARGRDAFRRVLVESGIAPEDQFQRRFGQLSGISG